MSSEFAAVRAAVGYVCDLADDTLTPDTRFADIDADSLVRVGVADLVEQHLDAAAAGWRIDDGVLGRAETLGELADHVARLRAASAVPAP